MKYSLSLIVLTLLLSACSSEWLTAQVDRPGLQLRPGLLTEISSSPAPLPSTVPSATARSANTVQAQGHATVNARDIHAASGSKVCISITCNIEETKITQIQPILSPVPHPQPSTHDPLAPTESPSPIIPQPTAKPQLTPESPVAPTPTPEPTPPSQELGPVNVTAFAQAGWTPEIIADGPHVGILTSTSSGATLYRSSNYGQTFEAIDLNLTIGRSNYHNLVRQPDGAWLLFYISYQDGRLYIRRSNNQGLSWGAPIRIGEGFSGHTYQEPKVTFANGQGYLVVNVMVNRIWDLYLFRFDSTLNMSPPVNITNDVENNDNPQIAVTSDGQVHVSYIQYSSPSQFMLTSSHDNGDSFNPPMRIDHSNTTPENPEQFFSFPLGNTSMVADGKRLYIGYNMLELNAEPNIYLAWRPDSDTPFQRTRINDVTYNTQKNPILKVDAQRNVYAMWRDNRINKNYGTHAWSISTDGGQSFAPSKLLDQEGFYPSSNFTINPHDPNWVYITANYNNELNSVSEVRFFRKKP